MSSVRRRVTAAAGAHVVGQALNIVYQLIGVPIFLWAWGTERYGEWLLLTAVPSFLSMSNVGFCSAAASQMAIYNGRNDRPSALLCFQAAWTIVVILSLAMLITACSLFGISDKYLTLFRDIGPDELRYTGIVLTLQIIAIQVAMLFDAGFRSVGLTSRGIHWINIYRLATFIACMGGLGLKASVLSVAAAMAISQSVVVFAMRIDLYRTTPWLALRLTRGIAGEFGRLTVSGFAFMAFPLGQSLRNQGVLLMLGIATNPPTVVLYSALRTLTNSVFQSIRTLQRAFLPELSVAYGSGDLSLLRKLHRSISQLSLFLVSISSAALLLFGEALFLFWTRGQLQFDYTLFVLLLAAGILSSLWNANLAVAMSINAHRRQSLVHIVATCLGLALCFVLIRAHGIAGAAIAILLIDLTMLVSVVPHTLLLTGDRWTSFLRSHLSLPVPIRSIKIGPS
jgi:O-antigen/teichoic acid export membrane protein